MDQINSIKEISMDGFQVVSGSMFRHRTQFTSPTATIWPDYIGFNKNALLSLNNCERVRIEVNTAKRCILVVPVTESDRDGIRWAKNTQIPAQRKMWCEAFAAQLYDIWELDSQMAYKATGKPVSADGKIMLLFDFSNPDCWMIHKKEKKEDGK